MIRRGSVVRVVVVAWTFCGVGLAEAQLPLSTFAGRQIGDGRPATAASLSRPFGVTFAPDGALIIAERVHNRLRRVDPATGVITTLAGSVSGASGNGMIADQAEMRDPLRVHLDAATGDLLVAEFDGQVVRRLSAATGTLSLIAGSPTSAGYNGDGIPAATALLNGPTEAVADGAGGVLISDRDNHRIRRIDGFGNISTVAGLGTPAYTGDAGLAVFAQLNSPACILPIPGGGFFLCDEQNHVIRRVDALGVITTVAGNGIAGFADGAATLGAQLNTPVNLAFADGTGTVLLIADAGNHRIRRLDLTGGQVTTIAGTGTNEFTPDGAPAASSPVSNPVAITLAPDGRIVFAEDGAHRVRAIDASGNLVTLAGDGVARFGGDGGPAIDAQFGQVKGVTRDGDGNFLVSDAGNNRVRRVNLLSGVVDTVAGSGEAAFSGDGGPAVDAGLTLSDALEDANGNILISDTDNHRIRRVDTAGVITTVVGTGVAGFTGDGGPASAAQVGHPTGIELDAAGNLYIADFDNSAIRKVDPSGIITTVAGTGSPVPGFNGDDIPATTALLFNPTDMTVDAAGNLYIADFGNHRVRRVDAATGIITTVAGTGLPGNDGDGGPANVARFNFPSDVKLDETGALWVTDFGNHRVRRLTVGGNVEAVLGSGLRGYAGDGGDPLQARLLFPLRLLVLASDQVLVADRDNFVVRLLGEISVDCTGEGAATCVPGGGKSGADCFMEFKIEATLPAGVPPPKISCVDGDASCDGDGVNNGQCTFRLGGCLNNEDARVPCVPGSITSVKLTGNQGKGAGGQSLAGGIGSLAASTPLSKGVGVAFSSAFAERNVCTPFAEFVVPRKRKKGKGALNAVVTTVASGKDKDKLKLFCLAP